MKVIRGLWGSQKHVLEEVQSFPIFDDEIVYVWGKENQKMLDYRGFSTVSMGKDTTKPEFSTIHDHFAHKLEIFCRASEEWGEFLYLDWDVKIVKPIDKDFWSLIRKGQPIQCPVYGYPSEYERKIHEHLRDNPQKKWVQELDPNTYEWVRLQNQLLEKYHWSFQDLQLVPNACFFYSRDSDVSDRLMEIYRKGEIKTCIEEFCMFIYSNCSLEDYIFKYEPLVIRGREDDCYHFDLEEDDTLRRINSYVDTKINKNIYLKHL
jgi:hypothetical protein